MRKSLCEMYELSRFHGAFFTALRGTHQHSNIRVRKDFNVFEGTLSSMYALARLLTATTESRAATATISAQETTPGQIDSN